MMVGRMKFIVRNYIAHIARRKYSDTIVNDLSRIFCWVVVLIKAHLDGYNFISLWRIAGLLMEDGHHPTKKSWHDMPFFSKFTRDMFSQVFQFFYSTVENSKKRFPRRGIC